MLLFDYKGQSLHETETKTTLHCCEWKHRWATPCSEWESGLEMKAKLFLMLKQNSTSLQSNINPCLIQVIGKACQAHCDHEWTQGRCGGVTCLKWKIWIHKNVEGDTHRVFSQRKKTIFWSSELLLPSRVVLSTGRVNSLSGPASAFGGLLFSGKECRTSCTHAIKVELETPPLRFSPWSPVYPLPTSLYSDKVRLKAVKNSNEHLIHTPAIKWDWKPGVLIFALIL